MFYFIGSAKSVKANISDMEIKLYFQNQYFHFYSILFLGSYRQKFFSSHLFDRGGVFHPGYCRNKTIIENNINMFI